MVTYIGETKSKKENLLGHAKIILLPEIFSTKYLPKTSP